MLGKYLMKGILPTKLYSFEIENVHLFKDNKAWTNTSHGVYLLPHCEIEFPLFPGLRGKQGRQRSPDILMNRHTERKD